MADKRISQLVDRGTVANNDVVPIVVSGATTTNKATISSIQTYMQGNLDLGVTSVGITLGSSGTDVSVSGSPITSSGNITINFPTASATNRGLLSSADWSTFNNKANAGDYVTLATTQTITAQKTFTTSGSSDTMIISHGSGSGFALDVLKAGNGEAIRVTKTSGSGNAMTISGGNFEAGTIVKTGGTSVQYLMADGSVSTLTNPVTGTGAAGQVAFWNGTNSQTGSNNLFWDNANVKLGIGISTPEATGLTVAGGGILVSLDSGAARKVLELYATSTGAKVSSTYVGASSYGSLELLTSNTPRLTITAAGDSTFSGALNGTSASFTGDVTASSNAFFGTFNGNDKYHFEPFTNAAGGANNAYLVSGKTDNNERSGFVFQARNSNGDEYNALIVEGYNSTSTTPALTLASTGAATFSSTISATGTIRTDGSSNGILLRNGYTAEIVNPTNNTRDIQFNQDTNATVMFKGNGNVGIGTASPSWQLQVEKNTNASATGQYPAVVVSNSNASGYTAHYLFNGATNKGGIEYSNGEDLMRVSSAGAMLFLTSATERMRITSGGSVLVNRQTLSAASLQAVGSLQVNNEIMSTGAFGGVFWENRSGGVTSTSNWYGWYTTGGTIFLFNGSANIASINSTTGVYTPLSDINKKKDFEESTIGLNEVMALKPTLYRMESDESEGEKELGFIAQEVQEFIPQAYVESGEEDAKFIGLNYNAIVAALVKAVQELKTQIDSLKNQIK